MIVRMSGVLVGIDTTDPKLAVLELELPGAGVVHGLEAPGYLAASLGGRVGSPLTVHTMQYLEGSPAGGNLVPRTVAFERPDEREFFELFTSVKGIGMRKALRALVQPPGLVAEWVERGDAKSLATLPEVGKRLAETIIAALKGKLGRFVVLGPARSRLPAEATPTPAAVAGHAEREAVEILIAWGDKPADAERAVEQLRESEPGFSELDGAGIVRAVYRRRGR
jgi:Holliday junction DNA helicase RuvA